jgi:hypothetical protein
VISGVAVVLGLVFTILVVPITVVFRVDRLDEIKGQLGFRWLFGLVRFQSGIPGADRTKPRRDGKPVKKINERKAGRNARGMFSLMRQSDFRRHAIRFIRNLLRAIHARSLYLHLRIGLGDPADTGRLWALVGPVAGVAANLRNAEVHLEPEFMEPVLEIESHGEIRLVPLQFIALAVAFVVSPTTIRAWYALRQSHV